MKKRIGVGRTNESHQELPEGLVKSAARTLKILELITDEVEGMSLRELARRLSIPISSAYSLANTLVAEGYLRRDEGSQRLMCGPMLRRLGRAILTDESLISRADPIMQWLQDESNETSCLSVLSGDSIVLIHKRATLSRIQVVDALGSRLPAHATGSGKVILAYLPEEEMDRIYPGEELPRLTPTTIVDKRELQNLLMEVRICKYACDNEESVPGVWAVAGCIQNAAGIPVAAVSIVAPAYRMTDKRKRNASGLIVEGSSRISSALGFRT